MVWIASPEFVFPFVILFFGFLGSPAGFPLTRQNTLFFVLPGS